MDVDVGVDVAVFFMDIDGDVAVNHKSDIGIVVDVAVDVAIFVKDIAATSTSNTRETSASTSLVDIDWMFTPTSLHARKRHEIVSRHLPKTCENCENLAKSSLGGSNMKPWSLPNRGWNPPKRNF